MADERRGDPASKSPRDKPTGGRFKKGAIPLPGIAVKNRGIPMPQIAVKNRGIPMPSFGRKLKRKTNRGASRKSGR